MFLPDTTSTAKSHQTGTLNSTISPSHTHDERGMPCYETNGSSYKHAKTCAKRVRYLEVALPDLTDAVNGHDVGPGGIVQRAADRDARVHEVVAHGDVHHLHRKKNGGL